ncbi:hypothetical protein M1563_00675 [Patescibacteria group bacterium]|nr:hypothetical protein [Patescibacteria group bacterium]MCL5410131.1 hypothetical protein [Patescibacteria group bacterium]
MRTSQQGFTSLIMVVGILLLLGVAGGVYYFTRTNTLPTPPLTRNSSPTYPTPSQLIDQRLGKTLSKEMIIKGYAKDVQTKNIISNPKVTFSCETGLNTTCESSASGSFLCRAEVKEGDHCGVYVGFTTSISGKIENTALAQYVGGQPGQTVDIGDMFVPLENEEDQKNMAQAFNLFESYMKAYVKENWDQINNLGIDCGLDRGLVAKYGLKWFIQNSTGQNGDIYSYGVSLRDCENGCDIQKNKIFNYELYLQKVSQQWKCWNKSKGPLGS